VRVELSDKDVCDIRQCVEARLAHCKRMASNAEWGGVYWNWEVDRWTKVLNDFDAKTKTPVIGSGYPDELGGWKNYVDPDML